MKVIVPPIKSQGIKTKLVPWIMEALQLLKRKGVGQASRQLGVSTATLYKWRDSFKELGNQGLMRKQSQHKDPDLARLKRENRDGAARAAKDAGGREGSDRRRGRSSFYCKARLLLQIELVIHLALPIAGRKDFDDQLGSAIAASDVSKFIRITDNA